jgi:hypothetical protein
MSIPDETVLPLNKAAPKWQDDLFDAADYRAELEGLGLEEAQGREILSTLWSMMAAMVQLGFDNDLCGQILEEVGIGPSSGTHVVQSLSEKES